jgi:hypothetical protein
VTPLPPRARSGPLRSSAARTMSFVFAMPAPACTTAVRPSFEIDIPGCGLTTCETRGSAFSRATAWSMTCCPAPLVTAPASLCTTTCSAALDIPPNSLCTICLTCTDCELEASQPAPPAPTPPAARRSPGSVPLRPTRAGPCGSAGRSTPRGARAGRTGGFPPARRGTRRDSAWPCSCVNSLGGCSTNIPLGVSVSTALMGPGPWGRADGPSPVHCDARFDKTTERCRGHAGLSAHRYTSPAVECSEVSPWLVRPSCWAVRSGNAVESKASVNRRSGSGGPASPRDSTW